MNFNFYFPKVFPLFILLLATLLKLQVPVEAILLKIWREETKDLYFQGVSKIKVTCPRVMWTHDEVKKSNKLLSNVSKKCSPQVKNGKVIFYFFILFFELLFGKKS